MGLFGSDTKKTTNNYTESNQLNDQSYTEANREYDDSFNHDDSQNYEDSFNVYTDQGAIDSATEMIALGMDVAGKSFDAMAQSNDSAFEFGRQAMNAIETSNKNALVKMETMGNNALSFVENISRDSGSMTAENVIKYVAIAGGVIGVAIALKGK